MKIYNATLFFTGLIIGFVGVYLDYSHTNETILTNILLILGTVIIVLAFRKPKGQKKG